MVEAGLRLPHGIRMDAERQVLGLGQAVVAAGELLPEHLRVLNADRVEPVVLERDSDGLLKTLRVRRKVHKRQLKVDGAVEKVQEAAPFLKDGGLVLLLGELVVDVRKLDGLSVVVGGNAADAVREHPLKGNRLLRRARYPVIPAGGLHDGLNLLLFLFGQVCGILYRLPLRAAFFQLCKQWHLPPVPCRTAASGRRNSCPSGRGAPSGGQICSG